MVQIGKRDLIIIAEDVDGEAMQPWFEQTPRRFERRRCQSSRFWRSPQGNAQDIAILTNASLISEETGRKLENATLEDLGRAEKLPSTKTIPPLLAVKATVLPSRAASIRFVRN